MKCLIAIPYKIIAVLLVGTAIVMAGVFAVGIPFQIASFF